MQPVAIVWNTSLMLDLRHAQNLSNAFSRSSSKSVSISKGNLSAICGIFANMLVYFCMFWRKKSEVRIEIESLSLSKALVKKCAMDINTCAHLPKLCICGSKIVSVSLRIILNSLLKIKPNMLTNKLHPTISELSICNLIIQRQKS